jgi:hypothetical protein
MSAVSTNLKPYAPDAAADRVSARIDQILINERHRSADVITSANIARLRRLEAALAAAEQHEHRFRCAREEEEMLLLRRPLTTARAYALFGLLLGALPPAAILFRLLGPTVFGRMEWGLLYIYVSFSAAMLAGCCLVGYYMGRKVGRRIDEAERVSWLRTIIASLAAGFVWSSITGAAGGAIVFLIGALFGLLCALPVGLMAFPLFTVCHRLLAHGGMIDARHFWPVACGVAMIIAALILSPGLIPY